MPRTAQTKPPEPVPVLKAQGTTSDTYPQEKRNQTRDEAGVGGRGGADQREEAGEHVNSPLLLPCVGLIHYHRALLDEEVEV